MTLPSTDRSQVMQLARSAVHAAVAGEPLPQPPGEGILGEPRGCFVTLTNRGRLRGCIGTFNANGPLGEMIVQMADAAVHDPRFTAEPITTAELPELTVEVSILSPLQETDEPHKLQVGRHGIFVVRGFRSGCFLPEVATDVGWTAEEFLSHCCAGKAGLPPDAWKQPGTKVYLFTTEKFSDEPPSD